MPIIPADRIKTFLNALRRHFPPTQLFTEPSQCWPYGFDNSKRHGMPTAVVFPQQHSDVEIIVRHCAEHRVPLVARGRGTGTTGGSVPLHQAIVLSMEKMHRIINIDPANRAMRVEAGVLNQAVQTDAAKNGFFWPPDPTSAAYCTVGGNIALNSAGPRAVKYGTPRENVLALKAVTGAGQSIECGTYTTKGVVGYDLTRLLIGSEGTLAVITEAVLKLTPLAPSKATLRADYRDIHFAAKAVSQIMAQPVIPYAVEIMDGAALKIVREHSNINLPKEIGAMLMIEVDGQPDHLISQLQALSRAAQNDGLLQCIQAETHQEINALWATRKALSPALRTVAPKKINEDVVVPVSRLAELILGLETISKKYAIPIVNFGHAGNGNIHVNLLLESEEAYQAPATHEALTAVFDLVLALDGTLSGEHGIGIDKREFVPKALDPECLKLMREIKKIFDPQHILNPDKLFI